MQINTTVIRSGFDGKKCFVHARFCETPSYLIATAQHLTDITACDLFDGIYSSKSYDGGKTWTEFAPEENLATFEKNGYTVAGCDGTPMYHKKSGKVIVIGHTAQYEKDGKIPAGRERSTWYSVYNEEKGAFGEMKFVKMPEGYENCGNGCGQSIEAENGDLLIPVYYLKDGINPMFGISSASVMRCTFDGETIEFAEIGNELSLDITRGLGEPSVCFNKGVYYLTLRNDECALWSKSSDGLNYKEMHFWSWDDGSILQSYNTQQHFMTVGDELYLVYTRRGANNDHVFRHRAPLFAAKVNEKTQLVRDSEIIVAPERGARLGNFCAYSMADGRGAVMAAEWMQPVGCERYGSDNSIWLTFIDKE